LRMELDISRRTLPKGELRIARQFTAGLVRDCTSPEGTAESVHVIRHFVFSLCVFSTKDRRPCLTAQLRDRLWPFLGGIARELQMKVLSIWE